MINLHSIAEKHGFRKAWDGAREGISRDPWMMTIPGRYGHVYVWSEDSIAFSTTRHRAMKLVDQIDGAVVLQDGDDGMNVSFQVEYLKLVGKRLQLRKKRKLNAQQRADAIKRLQAYHFALNSRT